MQEHRIVANNEQTAILQPSQASQKKEVSISAELFKLAEARQASVSNATLELYSSHLAHFQLEDVREGLRKLSLRRRQEGETAFPDLATVLDTVDDARRDRRIAEENEKKREAEEAEAAYWRDHPEERVFFDPHEILKNLGKAAPDVKAPVRTDPITQCPCCGEVLLLEGAQLSQWTSKMLREYADYVEKRDSVKAEAEQLASTAEVP